MSSGILLLLPVFALCAIGVSRWSRRNLRLPPGPRKYPIVGNTLNAPKQYQWLQYAEWSKELDSDIIYLEVLGTSQIFLNTFDAANELLSRRSAIYSSRPVLQMMEIMGQTFQFAFIPYGERWRSRRRAFWQEFNPANSHHHESIQTRSARDLLRCLLQDPDNFLYHSRYTLGCSILEVTYRIAPQPKDDPIVALGDQVLRRVQDTPIFGAFLVDIIPAFKNIPSWMPGAGFQKLGEIARREVHELLETPFAMARELMASEKPVPSFVSRGLSRSTDAHGDGLPIAEEHALRDAAASAYEAGIDTTPSAVSTFFAAMLVYPEVQEKGQRELDAYLDRLPEFEDRVDLPYTQAIMFEVLRWQPTVPLGIAHLAISEDEYKGYYIPKNTAVSANIWAILNDETYFPDPRTFKPERFLIDGKIDRELSDMVMATFGFGRRVCPGRFMAMDSLWMCIVSVLYTFNIRNAVDENGQAITPNIEYYPIFIRQVVPFKCSIQPRSEKARKMIEESDE